jgi:hypothetical protein
MIIIDIEAKGVQQLLVPWGWSGNAEKQGMNMA